MPGIGPHHPVEIHIGTALRNLRRSAGLSQQAIAQRIGVAYQQIQKYEAGKNRISASRLWDFAQILGAPVASFFPDPRSEDACALMPEEEAFHAWVSLYWQMPESKRAAMIKFAEAIQEI